MDHTDLAAACPSCEMLRKERDALQGERDALRAVIEQLAAQTRIAMNNQAEAMKAIESVLGFSPDGARRLAS